VYHWDFEFLWGFRKLLLMGLGYTVAYTVICTVIGLAIGLAVAMGRLSQPVWLRAPLRAYVEVFRCTPVLVQLVWFYYALPVVLNVQIPATLAATIVLSLYTGAFFAEIFRGGIETEAARALGMRRFQMMRRVVLPQAFRRMVPPLLNQSILQLKNTSLLSVLALPDLLYQGQSIAHETYRPLETYTVVALAYFLVLLPATILVKRAETRLSGPAHA